MAKGLSEPVLLFLKSKNCRYCSNLSLIWSEIVFSLKEIYPKLRIVEKISDKYIIPKDLTRYTKWYPMILLIPGKIWNNSITENSKIKDGVQIMNGSWINNELVYDKLYDIKNINDFIKWFKVAIRNEEFREYQED